MKSLRADHSFLTFIYDSLVLNNIYLSLFNGLWVFDIVLTLTRMWRATEAGKLGFSSLITTVLTSVGNDASLGKGNMKNSLVNK